MSAIARKRDAPTHEDGEAFVEELRRDFFVKKGKLYWRKRDVSRFEARFPERAAAIWNSRFGNKPAGKRDKRLGADGALFVRLGTRSWPVEKLARALETGVAPFETVEDAIASKDEIFIGEGPLGLALAAAKAESGLSPDAITVLAAKYDPFRFDTPVGHRAAAWFADLFRTLVRIDRATHIRGFHYVLVSAGGVIKPDGKPYENTEADYDFLHVACKRARWLGYVGFDRIVDQRNPDPIINRSPLRPAPSVSVSASLGHGAFAEMPGDTEIGDCRPGAYLTGFAARQPYAFVFFGEKSSLEPVLAPLARMYQADLYLAAGELSDTLVWQMARDAAADGRPLIVFCFSDFDPAGAQMPVSIARKLQALKVMSFPNLRAQVVTVALTLEQAVQFRLPTTPVKAGEKRARRWQAAYGPALYEAGLISSPDQAAQVEIDALAALRPDDLRRIAEAAIAPYWDAGLTARVNRAAGEWWLAAQAEIDAAIDEEAFANVKARAEYAADRFNAALETLRKAQDELSDLDGELDDLTDEIAAPAPPAMPDAEVDESAHEPLLDLDWGLVSGAQALKARKAYEDDEP